jgi:head-tail adaptor
MYGKTYQIIVQETTESKDSGGEITDSWSEKGTVRGKIYQLSGSEQYESSKDTRIIKYRMVCNKPSFEITEDDKIKKSKDNYNYAIYDVNSPLITNEIDSIYYDIEVVNDISKLGKRYQIDLKEVDYKPFYI